MLNENPSKAFWTAFRTSISRVVPRGAWKRLRMVRVISASSTDSARRVDCGMISTRKWTMFLSLDLVTSLVFSFSAMVRSTTFIVILAPGGMLHRSPVRVVGRRGGEGGEGYFFIWAGEGFLFRTVEVGGNEAVADGQWDARRRKADQHRVEVDHFVRA